MKTTIRNPKFMWLGGSILVALYFGPSILRLAMRPALPQRQALVTAAQPTRAAKGRDIPSALQAASIAGAAPPESPATLPAAATPVGAPPPVSPAASLPTAPGAVPTAANLSGTWKGTAVLANHGGMCTMQLEIRPNQEEEQEFSGFSTFACPSFLPFLVMQPHRGANPWSMMLRQMQTTSGIFSGPVVNNSLQFRVEKIIGIDGQGCAMTSLTVTPFGSKQIAADWQEGASCQAGQMLLTKQGK